MKITLSLLVLAFATYAHAGVYNNVCVGKTASNNYTLDGMNLVIMPTPVAQGDLSKLLDENNSTEILSEDYNEEIKRHMDGGTDADKRLFITADAGGMGSRMNVNVLSSKQVSEDDSTIACVKMGQPGNRDVTKTVVTRQVQFKYENDTTDGTTVDMSCTTIEVSTCD